VEMVPETCAPTCTVMTALIVPVASTTERISPFSTFAVKYCGLSLPLNWKAAKTAIARRMPIVTSQCRLIRCTARLDLTVQLIRSDLQQKDSQKSYALSGGHGYRFTNLYLPG